MTLLAACTALLLLTLAVVLLPLLRRGTTTDASPDRAVYRAQIAELDHDIARGLLAPAEAEAARAEIARRLLATDSRPSKTTESGPSALLAGVLALILTGAAAGLYLFQGAPGLPTAIAAADSMPADSMPADQRAAMVRAMVERLAERLAAQPDDTEGWLRLGRAYLVLNEFEKSADAYDRAARQQPGPDIRIQEIAALIETTPPTAPLPARAQTLVNALATQAPDQPEIIWYSGLVAARIGQRADALRHWERLLTLLPPASQERKLVQSAIDALKGN